MKRRARRARSGILGLPLIRNVKTRRPGRPVHARGDPDRDRDGRGDRGLRGRAHDRGRPRPVRAGEDHQRPAGAALRRLRPRQGLRARPGRPTSCRSSTSTATYYKLVGDFDKRFPEGAPSLREADVADGRGRLDLRPRRRGRRRRRARGRRPPSGSRPARCSSDGRGRRWLTCCRVADHLERILAAVAPLPGLPAAADGGARARRWPRTCTPRSPLPSFDNSGDGRVRRGATRRRRRASEESPGAPAGGRRDRRRPGAAARDVARHRRQDHDRRAGARPAPTRSCPTSGPTAASPRCGSPGRPSRASTSGRAGEDVAEGDLLIERRHRARPAPPRPARRASAAPPSGPGPRPRVVVMSTGSELREPGHAARPRLDLRRQLLPARRRRPPRPARSPTGSGSCPTSRAPSSTRCSDQLVRADVVVTSGGVSQGDYDVVKEALAPLGTVWFGGVAMQPGKPQGFGVVGEDETPIFTLPGNPVSSYVSFEMFVLPAIRRLMGQPPYVRPDGRAPGSPTPSRSPAGRAAVRARRATTSTAAAPCVTPVGGARLAPDRRPRRRPTR